MSAEVDWFFEDASLNKRGEHIDEGELAWTPGYGDGSGKEIGIMIVDGAAKIVRASVQAYEDEAGDILLNVAGAEELDELPVGEPRMRRVRNPEGEMGIVHVRNLGICPRYPDMRPAWN